MILASAHYKLLEGEEEWFAANEGSGWHQLDGEICLHFSDAPPIFISWHPKPVVYSIGLDVRSFFSTVTLRSVDLSTHSWWRDLVSRELQLNYLDLDKQVLCVATGAAKIFLTSQYDDGTFQGDCVRVSPTMPERGERPAAQSYHQQANSSGLL